MKKKSTRSKETTFTMTNCAPEVLLLVLKEMLEEGLEVLVRLEVL